MHAAVSGRFLAVSSEVFTAAYTEVTAVPQQYTLYTILITLHSSNYFVLFFLNSKYLNKMKKSLKIRQAFTWDSQTLGNQFMPVKC
jgi:hypothetical protein